MIDWASKVAAASDAEQAAQFARRSRGLPLPGGKPALAVGCALLFGLIGAVLPMGWIESLSYQLYLDTITSHAAAPLGMTARLIFAGALATGGAIFGLLLGQLFKVYRSGTASEASEGVDEYDAPILRSVDRHPDAPARRPLSAARDLPRSSTPVTGMPVADGGDELVLDGSFFPSSKDLAPAAERQPGAVVESDLSATMTAPHPDDWYEPRHEPAPIATDDLVAEIAGGIGIDDGGSQAPHGQLPAEASAAHPATRTPARRPEPLDLSAAGIDELLARLEAGMTRRRSGAAVPAPVIADAPAEAPAAESVAAPMAGAPDVLPVRPAAMLAIDDEPAPGFASMSENEPAVFEPAANDPAYPHDPALAAALATLRRLNQRAG